MSRDQRIVTAASAECGLSLLALLGSITLNWPSHPPVLVYDVGLDSDTLATLERHRIQVRKVPAFCSRWRDYYIWKLWCLHDAPSLDILWLDAGVILLDALDEVFGAIAAHGYFVTTNGDWLETEASEGLCHGCAVAPAFRAGKVMLSATVIGFRKMEKVQEMLDEALSAAMDERHVAPVPMSRRSDHAILSLLVYKHLGQVVVADSAVYLGRLSPVQEPQQKVWVHRNKLLLSDAEYLSSRISTPVAPYRPASPFTLSEGRAIDDLYRAVRCFGRSDRQSAAAHFRDALGNANFLTPLRLASIIHGYRQTLNECPGHHAGDAFAAWAATVVRRARGRTAARRVRSALYGLEGISRLERREGEEGCLLLTRSVFTHPSFAVAYRREITKSLARAVQLSGRQMPPCPERSNSRWRANPSTVQERGTS